MDVSANFYLLFFVILYYCLEVSFFTQSVFIDLLIDCLREIYFFLFSGFLFNTTGIKGFESEIVEFTLEVSSFFYVIIDVEIDGNLKIDWEITLYI
jgi:hypothetical protein